MVLRDTNIEDCKLCATHDSGNKNVINTINVYNGV